MDEIHKLLEVQLCPGERISHKELATVPIEVSLQPDRYEIKEMKDQNF